MILATGFVLAVIAAVWWRALLRAGVLVFGLVGATLLASVLASLGWADFAVLVFMLGLVAGTVSVHRRLYPEMWLISEFDAPAIQSQLFPPTADSEPAAGQ